MNQAEAKDLVLRTTINSLRGAALVPARIKHGMDEKTAAKISKECEKLATMLDKRRRPSEPATGQPVPEGRADDIPKDPDAAREGEQAAAAGEHQP